MAEVSGLNYPKVEAGMRREAVPTRIRMKGYGADLKGRDSGVVAWQAAVSNRTRDGVRSFFHHRYQTNKQHLKPKINNRSSNHKPSSKCRNIQRHCRIRVVQERQTTRGRGLGGPVDPFLRCL